MTRFPIDGTSRLASESEHPTAALTGPAGGALTGSYPNPTVLSSVTVSGLVGGSTDNTAVVQAAVAALDQTYGGTLLFPRGKWYVKGPVVLPRLAATGQIHIDLGGCTVWTDQGNPIFQCLVSRSLGHDPTDLLGGCVDWEIRNGVLLSSNSLAGSRGIQIEASYNLRFRGLHFWQFEIGEEVRFGLMHSDEDCRYTNCTLAGALHGSGEAAGHVDGTTSLAGATITVPTTLGFDNSGSLTVCNTGSGDRSGATSTVTYTGKTATTFTGCTLTVGSNSAAAGSLFFQTLWAGASTSDGCNASTHKGRHYCGSGQHAALAVICTDGQVVQPGSVFEGSNPLYNILVDGGGLNVVDSFAIRGEAHLENTPSLTDIKLNGQGRALLDGLNHQTGATICDNRWSTVQDVVVANMSLAGVGSKFQSLADEAHTWTFLNCSGSDWTLAAQWVGSIKPTRVTAITSSKGIKATVSSLAEIDNPGSVAGASMQLTAADVAKFYQDTFQVIDVAGTHTALTIVTGASATIGFYGHSPTSQQLLATGAGHTVDDVITALQTLGLLRQS